MHRQREKSLRRALRRLLSELGSQLGIDRKFTAWNRTRNRTRTPPEKTKAYATTTFWKTLLASGKTFQAGEKEGTNICLQKVSSVGPFSFGKRSSSLEKGGAWFKFFFPAVARPRRTGRQKVSGGVLRGNTIRGNRPERF